MMPMFRLGAMALIAAGVEGARIARKHKSNTPSDVQNTIRMLEPEVLSSEVDPELQKVLKLAEPELQAASPERPVKDSAEVEMASGPHVQQWTFHTGETVGWVYDDPIPRGSTGPIRDFRRVESTGWEQALVDFGRVGRWWIYILACYKPNSRMYGFRGGQVLQYVGPEDNAGGIAEWQNGIVQTFSEVSPHSVIWWDPKQEWFKYVPPSRLETPNPYAPVQGNGAWVPLHSVNVGQGTIRKTIGTSKSYEETKTASWASSTTATLSTKMTAGVDFLFGSVEVEVGMELSTTMSQEHARGQAWSWTKNYEEEYSFTLPPNSGFLWQWMVKTMVRSGDILTSKTWNFALTKGRWEKPRCLPGYEMDGAACQVCYNNETTLIKD